MTQKSIKIIKTITTMGEDKRRRARLRREDETRRARLRREDERRRARLLRHMRARRTRFLAVCIFIIEDNFRDSLTDEQKQRRQRNLPRSALVDPFHSPWMVLFRSGEDQPLITTTGFDHRAFEGLVAIFKPWFDAHTPWVGANDGTKFKPLRSACGRKRILDASTCLGLVLSWFRFRGAEWILQGWFGLTGGHANTWLRFGRRGLLLLLWNNEYARIEQPSDEKIILYQEQVVQKHPLLHDVYCVCDGLKLAFQASSDDNEQGMFYNGWTHGHYVTNLFVFAICGRIIMTIVNVPGSIHDSTLAEWGHIYTDLAVIYDRTGGVCCVDSAFCSKSNPFILKSSNNYQVNEDALGLLRREQATSLRQAAEWGMRAIQSAFPRLKDTIKFEEHGERKVFLSLLPLLYNYRLATVGLNQLRNVYCRHWDIEATNFIYN